jgi:NAD(P)H-hydrate repair Nnr-like enzyme with NAD(P)H-hydrate dehydratase domain
VCERGNPGMATAGTGDVRRVRSPGSSRSATITGRRAGGVLVHAMAGDGPRARRSGVLASDLTRELHHRVNL